MDTGPIVWLEDAAAAVEETANDAGASLLAEVGTKAWSLARLLAAGLPVPPGFVVCSGALEDVWAAGRLARGAAPAQDAALPEALPGALQEVIRAAYATLGARLATQEPLVAVRSSSTAEDLAAASFAGQYETFLGVRGAESVVAHVARCHRSLQAPRAAA
jgi:pyruvate,water dikinase